MPTALGITLSSFQGRMRNPFSGELPLLADCGLGFHSNICRRPTASPNYGFTSPSQCSASSVSHSLRSLSYVCLLYTPTIPGGWWPSTASDTSSGHPMLASVVFTVRRKSCGAQGLRCSTFTRSAGRRALLVSGRTQYVATPMIFCSTCGVRALWFLLGNKYPY